MYVSLSFIIDQFISSYSMKINKRQVT